MSAQTIKSILREGHEAVELKRIAKRLQAHAGKTLVKNTRTQNGAVLVQKIQQTSINWQFALIDDDYHEDGRMQATVRGKAIYDKRNNSTPIPNYGEETKKEIVFCVHVIDETPINEQWKQKPESDGEVKVTNGVVEYTLTIPCYKQVYIKAYDKKQDVEGYSKTFVAEPDQELTNVPVVFYADKKEEFKTLKRLYEDIKNHLLITGKLTAQQAKEYAQSYEPLIKRAKEADDKAMLAINKQLRELIESLRALDVKARIWSEKQFENLKEHYNQLIKSLQTNHQLTKEQVADFAKRFKEILNTSKTNLQEALSKLQALIQQLLAKKREHEAQAEYAAGYIAYPDGRPVRFSDASTKHHEDFTFGWMKNGTTNVQLLPTKTWTKEGVVHFLIDHIPPGTDGKVVAYLKNQNEYGYSEEFRLAQGEHEDNLYVHFKRYDDQHEKTSSTQRLREWLDLRGAYEAAITKLRNLQNHALVEQAQSTFSQLQARYQEARNEYDLKEVLVQLRNLVQRLTQEANTRRYQANAEYIAGYAAWPSGEAIRSQQENLYADFRFYWVERGKTQPHLLRNTKKWTQYSGVYYLIDNIPPGKPGRVIGRWISQDNMGYSEEITLKKGEHQDYLPVTFPDPNKETPKIPDEIVDAIQFIKENRA